MEYKEHKPFVIAISSGKGGVGKSVLAANLAHCLSGSLSVLLWDADMYFPNQHLLIGVEPPVRLNDVYAGNISVDKAMFQVSENLDLLADMPAGGTGERIDPSVIAYVYNEILSVGRHDLIIIDTPAGGSYEVLQCASLADLVAIIITDEPTSLLDAYALVKIMMPYIDTKAIKLLVNNVIDNEDATDISRKLNLATENFLALELDYIGYVPYNRAVRQSILRQELLVKSNPDSEVTSAIKKIADGLLKKIKIPEMR